MPQGQHALAFRHTDKEVHTFARQCANGWQLVSGTRSPGLGGACMVVIDAVEVVVLIVPAEAGKEHAKVQPGVGDASNGLPDGLQR